MAEKHQPIWQVSTSSCSMFSKGSINFQFYSGQLLQSKGAMMFNPFWSFVANLLRTGFCCFLVRTEGFVRQLTAVANLTQSGSR